MWRERSKVMSSFVCLEVTLLNAIFQQRQFKKSHLFLVSVQEFGINSLVLIRRCFWLLKKNTVRKVILSMGDLSPLVYGTATQADICL